MENKTQFINTEDNVSVVVFQNTHHKTHSWTMIATDGDSGNIITTEFHKNRPSAINEAKKYL